MSTTIPRRQTVVLWISLVMVAAGIGCGRAGFEATVTSCAHPLIGTPIQDPGVLPADHPISLAIGEDGFGVVWTGSLGSTSTGNQQAYLSVYAEDGKPVGSPLQVSLASGVDAYFPSVAFQDGAWAVQWIDQRDGEKAAYFRLVKDFILGIELRLSEVTDSGFDWMTAIGVGAGRFAGVWHDAHEVYVQVVDSASQKVGGIVQLTDDPFMTEPPSVSFGHDSFAVAYVDLRYSSDPYFARIGLDGTKLLKPVREATSPWGSSGVVLAFDGSNFAMVWREERNDRNWIAFAVVDQDGKEVVAPKLLELGTDPCCFSLAWTGEVYGLAWKDQQRLLFTELTATGEVITPAVNLGTPTGMVQQTTMAWGQGMFHFALVADERYNDGNDNWTNRQALSTSTVTCRP